MSGLTPARWIKSDAAMCAMIRRTPVSPEFQHHQRDKTGNHDEDAEDEQRQRAGGFAWQAARAGAPHIFAFASLAETRAGLVSLGACIIVGTWGSAFQSEILRGGAPLPVLKPHAFESAVLVPETRRGVKASLRVGALTSGRR